MDGHLWDDLDRTRDIYVRAFALLPLEGLTGSADCSRTEGGYQRVYVDEVQDYTQGEILLLLLAANLDTTALFLAGDPVQAVRPGVAFRFEEIRSLVYQVGQKMEHDKETYKIERPLKLTANFRSHSGILNCAAAVLDRMFAAFPGRTLSKDESCFIGPRPAFLQVQGNEELGGWLASHPRFVVLTADDKTRKGLEKLSAENLLLGIEQAKGLDFNEVAIVNFFSSLPEEDQKQVWRKLFNERHDTGPTIDCVDLHPQVESAPHKFSNNPNNSISYLLNTRTYTSRPTCMQVEQQLNRLYVAITRSVDRLVFVESQPSKAGDAFFKVLLSLARPSRRPFHSFVRFLSGWKARIWLSH